MSQTDTETTDSAAVVVVGAGIVGICTALSLAESGHDVMLVDRDEPAAGASMGNAGIITPQACVPQSMPGVWKHVPGWLFDPLGPVALRWRHLPALMPWLYQFVQSGSSSRVASISAAMAALNYPNLTLYQQWLAGTGQESLVRDCPYIFVSDKAADLALADDLGWSLRETHGARLERIDGDELRRREPALGRHYVGAVLVHDQGRTINPRRLGETLFDKARSLGVRFERGEVRSLSRQADSTWRVVMQGRSIHARQVALTAGVWSARLLESLGVKVLLEAERGYHLMFENPGCELSACISDVGGKFAMNSMEHGLRCAGTAEFAGIDAEPDYRRAEALRTLAKRALPDLAVEPATPWMGRRPSSPDSLPYIGEVPGNTGLFVGFGHAHLGLTGAPQTGRMLDALISGKALNIPMEPYRVDRFS